MSILSKYLVDQVVVQAVISCEDTYNTVILDKRPCKRNLCTQQDCDSTLYDIVFGRCDPMTDVCGYIIGALEKDALKILASTAHLV